MANLLLKKQTACLSQLHNISLSVCHFRKLLLAATITSSSVTITVNFSKIQLMFRHSSACAFRKFYALLQFTLQAELDVVMNKGDAIIACGLFVMPKHRNDRKTYRTICGLYSKITAVFSASRIFFPRFFG